MLIVRDPVPFVDSDVRDAAVTTDSGSHGRFVADFERAHGQTLFGFVRRLGVKDDAAADVVQEAMLRLFDALRAGQQIRDSKAWTFHVAYRLAMDEHRRLRRLRLAKARPHPTNVNDPGDDVERQQVWSEVDRLPDRQRAVLFLKISRRPCLRGHRCDVGDHRERCPKPLHSSARNLTSPPRREGRLMDDRRIEAALRAGGPDEPEYRGDISELRVRGRCHPAGPIRLVMGSTS